MSGAAVDRPVLEQIATRLRTTRQFERVRLTHSESRLRLRASLDPDYYPDAETVAELTVQWFQNDDCYIHYREDRPASSWACRWDRHPSSHDQREQFHPPPDASTPGEPATWPDSYRDVIGVVLDRVERRVERLWRE